MLIVRNYSLEQSQLCFQVTKYYLYYLKLLFYQNRVQFLKFEPQLVLASICLAMCCMVQCLQYSVLWYVVLIYYLAVAVNIWSKISFLLSLFKICEFILKMQSLNFIELSCEIVLQVIAYLWSGNLVLHCIYSNNKSSGRDWGCLTKKKKQVWNLCSLFLLMKMTSLYKTYISRINC